MAEGTRWPERRGKTRLACAGGVLCIPDDGAVDRPRDPEVGGAFPVGGASL